jgi:hypothetical protein
MGPAKLPPNLDLRVVIHKPGMVPMIQRLRCIPGEKLKLTLGVR